MGNARSFRYACALAAVIGLTGCDRRMWSEDEIVSIAGEAEPYKGGDTERTMRHERQIAQLEARIADLEQDIAGVRALGLENAGNAERIRAAVVGNAKIANQEKLAEMTRRGACGTRTTRLESGVIMNTQIPCTVADLQK